MCVKIQFFKNYFFTCCTCCTLLLASSNLNYVFGRLWFSACLISVWLMQSFSANTEHNSSSVYVSRCSCFTLRWSWDAVERRIICKQSQLLDALCCWWFYISPEFTNCACILSCDWKLQVRTCSPGAGKKALWETSELEIDKADKLKNKLQHLITN